MVQRVKPALVREREPAMLEKKKWNETAKRSEGGSRVGGLSRRMRGRKKREGSSNSALQGQIVAREILRASLAGSQTIRGLEQEERG